VSSRSPASWLTVAALLLTGCACERVDLAVTGDSTRLRADDPLPKTSALFDGERVRLRGVRGETLGVTVHLDDGREHELELSLPEHVASVTAFQLGFVRVREPSTAMYGESRGKGRYPDLLTPVSDLVTADESAYFDVALRSDAPAGLHRGELRVGKRRLSVELAVQPLSIDLTVDPLVWVFYLPKEIARVHGVPEDDGRELIELEARYHRLFREHGTLLATNLPPARFPPRRRFMHDVRHWPVALDLSSDAAIANDVRRWLELFEGSQVTPFTIPVDEPATHAEKQRAAHIARVIGQAGGGAPRLLRAVTDRVNDVYEDAIDVWFSPSDIPRSTQHRRAGGERLWTYNGKPPGAGSMIIDTDGVALRTWGWIAYAYGIDLWYAWEGLYFSDRYNRGGPTDLERDTITFDERTRGGQDFGNGDGLLVYPGPRPSLRLKALRRGLTDRLLLRALERCGGREQAHQIARRLIPRALGEAGNKPSWPRDERAFEAAKGEVLDAIAERGCHG
jgi:hypothetical protein